jgi:hypothetical protein
MLNHQDSKLVLLDPTVGARPEAPSLAPRLATLEGITIGLLDNTKDNSDRVLDYIADILDQQFHFAGIIRRRKLRAGMPPSASLIAEMKSQTHAIITGVGD